jgi:predicted RNase H-like HicB family nuclease
MSEPVAMYTATYEFDGRTWIVEFRELGIATFGQTLGAATRYARSALAVHLEVASLEVAGVDVIDDVREKIEDDVGR